MHSTYRRLKRSLTLLEVVIATVLLGILLFTLFHVFRQGLKSSALAKEQKQRIVQLELAHHYLHSHLRKGEGVWIAPAPDSSGMGLWFDYTQQADPQFIFTGMVQAVVYLNRQNELCVTHFSASDATRTEILLDGVSSCKYRIFSPKNLNWLEEWPEKKGKEPVMAGVDLFWQGQEVPLIFFLKSSREPILYPAGPPS